MLMNWNIYRMMMPNDSQFKLCAVSRIKNSTYLGHTECYVYRESIEAILTEREILNILFDVLDRENWALNMHWKDNDVNICEWYGIICKFDIDEITSQGIESSVIDALNTQNQVIGISLCTNRLTGPIPREIYLLPSLIFVDVGRNAITFPIDDIGESSLVYLILTNTNTASLKGIEKALSLRTFKADRTEMTAVFQQKFWN